MEIESCVNWSYFMYRSILRSPAHLQLARFRGYVTMARGLHGIAVLLVLCLLRELQTVLAASEEEKANCWDIIVNQHDFGNVHCLQMLLVQFLNFGVMAGSFTYKLPQIIKLARAHDATGISGSALYFETLGFLTSTIYHVRMDNPIGAWGENLIILAQQVALVAQLWLYSKSSMGHVLLVLATAAGLVGFMYKGVPREYVPMLFTATIPMASASRIPQIWTNFSNGHTGQLSFVTLFLGFAGSAARVFTSMKQVADPQVAFGFGLACLWNLILVLQVLMYWSKTDAVLKARAGESGEDKKTK